MTFVWRHPDYYRKLRKQLENESDQEKDNNQDKEESHEPQDLQSQE